MLIDAKTKSDESQKTENCHFSRILYNGTEIWKYASFEGSKNAQNPWFYRHLSTKKAPLKSAIFGNSRSEKAII